MTWIQTYTGVKFDLANPRPEDVRIEDIAHALAHTCRFNGHCLRHYSVAEHSLLMAWYLVPGAMRKQALLHDAAEAYVGDVVRPLKSMLGREFATIERRVQLAIGNRFDVCLTDLSYEVRRADLVMLATEQRDLMAPPPAPWENMPEPCRTVSALGWPAHVAEAEFVRYARTVGLEASR